jgi:hypothetical protein
VVCILYKDIKSNPNKGAGKHGKPFHIKPPKPSLMTKCISLYRAVVLVNFTTDEMKERNYSELYMYTVPKVQ